MKKIIYTLLVAVMALSFMGCPTVYEDLAPQVDLSPFYLRGNMNNWCNDALTDGALTKNDDGSFSITYTAKAEPDEFAIADEGWGVKYCNGTEIAVGADFVELGSGGANAKVTGQVPGNNYKMTIKPLSTSIEVKVELAGVNVPSFYVLDTTKGLVEIPYDGTAYNYQFSADAETANLVIWSDKVYYTGEATVGTAKELTAGDEVGYLTVSGVASGKDYIATLTVDDDKVSVTVTQMCPYFIVGDISGAHVRMSATDEDGVYVYEFTYKNDMNAWSGSNGNINFVITEGSGWNKKITGIALTSTFADSLDNNQNATATGLVDGKTYVITLKEADGKFSAKIAEKQ
ncbi:MAG: hypothetical protein E7064_09140 [Spirochaetaceae bacterium]|nr:hypothetical protein [Spirochaetaceae bacterium]